MGTFIGAVTLVVVVVIAPILIRNGPRRTANTVRAIKSELDYRAEDRRRAAEGLPSQQEQDDAIFNAFVASRGTAPADDFLKQAMGWNDATHGVAAREARINKLQREIEELKRGDTSPPG